MKQVLILLAVLFVVALAILAAPILSKEAVAVVVGVACGVAASIPVSLGLLLVLGKLPGLRSQRPGGEDVVVRQGEKTTYISRAEMVARRPADWAETVQVLGHPTAGWTARVIRGGKDV